MLTASCVQPARASLAFEVFCFLVVDKDLEVVEVALAVVAPGTCEELLDFGVLSLLLFAHVVMVVVRLGEEVRLRSLESEPCASFDRSSIDAIR